MNNQLTDDMFYEALLNEDELGSVLKAHLHIEYHIDKILNRLTPYPDDLPALKYSEKVCLICALGVKKEYKPILHTLGTIRNNFAHDPFSKINKSL